MRNSRNVPTQGSLDFPLIASESVQVLGRFSAALVFAEVYHPYLVADAISGEVDDYVIAFGNPLLVQLW